MSNKTDFSFFTVQTIFYFKNRSHQLCISIIWTCFGLIETHQNEREMHHRIVHYPKHREEKEKKKKKKKRSLETPHTKESLLYYIITWASAWNIPRHTAHTHTHGVMCLYLSIKSRGFRGNGGRKKRKKEKYKQTGIFFFFFQLTCFPFSTTMYRFLRSVLV